MTPSSQLQKPKGFANAAFAQENMLPGQSGYLQESGDQYVAIKSTTTAYT